MAVDPPPPASFPLPPPLAGFPIVNVDANGNTDGRPTIPFLNFLQLLWAGLQGRGGIIDILAFVKSLPRPWSPDGDGDGDAGFVIPGPQGQRGLQGLQGPLIWIGEDGDDGLFGPPGRDGGTGATGATGAAGTPGPPGQDGDGGGDEQLFMAATTNPAIIPYIVHFGILGSPLANSQAIYIYFPFVVTFPANFGAIATGQSSGATGTANATGSTAFSIDKRTASPNTFGTNVGSITIAAGGVVATLTTAGGTSYKTAVGELWRVIAPVSADATFANLAAALVGTR